MFAVVRSTECWEAKEGGALPDLSTGLTTYTAKGQTYSRFFHTPESIQEFLGRARFRIERLKTYNERLCIDFQRQVAAEREDALIELLAVK